MMAQVDVKQKEASSFMVSFDFTKTPITQIADYIIIAASKYNTSDIHFDPRDEGMMVRFRIDGDCQDYTFVPKAYEKNLTTRLKLLANMNITESRLPQDGAIKGTFGDQYLDMRVSALPLNEGEKIVIRILDYTRSLQGIDSLGFHPKNLEKIRRMMGIPNGIILTTGATGSGKSTTTYSILQELNKPETNVITVEDPIEMSIEGINQVQVNAEIGMTFAAALRSILRQDPNVILIGEIRDSETAQIAVRASITGHLVLSTIHTNNALATVERLLDMDVERYLLSTALTGIISQRLAKMLCPDCRIQREPTKYEKKIFKKYMNQDITTIWDANPEGCPNCRKGYHGRVAVHEVLEIDESIRNALSDERMEKSDLAKLVYSGNTITMLQDALIKCLDGKTSFEEVYRTIEIENEDDDNYENELNQELVTSGIQPQENGQVPVTVSTPTTPEVPATPTQPQAPVTAPVSAQTPVTTQTPVAAQVPVTTVPQSVPTTPATTTVLAQPQVPVTTTPSANPPTPVTQPQAAVPPVTVPQTTAVGTLPAQPQSVMTTPIAATTAVTTQTPVVAAPQGTTTVPAQPQVPLAAPTQAIQQAAVAAKAVATTPAYQISQPLTTTGVGPNYYAQVPATVPVTASNIATLPKL